MMNRFHWSEFALWGVAIIAVALAASPAFAQVDRPSVKRGRYISRIAGCNDCHTSGYAMSGGKVPESEWLKGDALGWNGPWGTTYASNLRRFMATMTEDEWVRFAGTTQLRPPMPWFALRDMSDADRRSLYRFIKSLGAPGEAVPSFVPPGQTPKGPFVRFPAPPQ